MSINHREILDLVNEVMAWNKSLGMKESLAMQDVLNKGIKAIIRKGTIGKEALSEFLFQKKPPHNLETEGSLIGKVLLFPGKTMPSCNIITTDFFYDLRHSLIWETIRYLWDGQKKVTMDSVVTHLTSMGKLDATLSKTYIEALAKDQSTVADFEDRVAELTSFYQLRGIWRVAAEAVQNSYSILPEEAEAFRHKVIEQITEFGQSQVKKYDDGASLAVKLRALKDKKELALAMGGYSGSHSPVLELDAITDGWQDTDVIVIAGRPGMGKTALAISDVAIALKNNEPVLFFSLEMSAVQLAARLFSVMEGYSLKDLFAKAPQQMSPTEAEVEQFKNLKSLAQAAYDKFELKLATMPIFIDDTPGVNWRYIQDKAMYFKQKYGIRRIYVDYLQLMSGIDPRVTNSEQVISENSRGLKIVAKTCGCPLFELSQLSRSCENRPDKRPNLSDLRSSGAIEQDADIVIFTYRDEYYGILAGDNGESLEGVGELIIAKHRNGPLGTVKAFFNAPYTKWNNLHSMPAGYTSGLKPKEEDPDFNVNMPF